MGDLNELVERLDKAVERCKAVVANDVHSGLNVVDFALMAQYRLSEAAAALTSLIGLREALSGLLRGEYESAEPGLCDCVDNHGKPYQSQFLADRIAAAEAALSLDTNKGDGE